jgi:hypothetical protein
MLKKFGIEIEGWSGLEREELAALITKDTNLPVSCVPWQRLSRAAKTWLLTTDGSFTNKVTGGKGYELVSPPLVGKEGLKELQLMISSIRNKKLLGESGKFVHNHRCALHVHMSVEEYSNLQKKKIYEMYKYLEPEINRMFPYSRVFNKSRGGESYCAPIKHVSFEQATDPDRDNNSKYYSVQFPVGVPTIEFRIHSATTNYNKAEKWIQILSQIIDFALDNTLITRWNEEEREESLKLQYILNKECYDYFNARRQKFDRQKSKKGVLV